MPRLLLLATTTGYQIRMFSEAAERLGVELVFATDRCDQLDDPWWDGAIAVRFDAIEAGVAAIAAAANEQPLQGLLALGDRATVLAAAVAGRLGLPGHPIAAATAARDKQLTRERLEAAGLLVPPHLVVRSDVDPRAIPPRIPFPLVVKPLMLSGSRGVMRADNPGELHVALERLRRLLDAPDVRALQSPLAKRILVEGFIPGDEFAVEGILTHGQLDTVAIFAKPDPLNGPFFEESIYVTPSGLGADRERAVTNAIAAAAAALDLQHGPIHAECRVNALGVYVLEIAARPIGGLCARAVHLVGPNGEEAGLEELLVRHALGERVEEWKLAPHASGVMMIPIPASGVYRGVIGETEAREVRYVTDVRITAKADQQIQQLPEGASYLGFIFAEAASSDEVEQALRTAHAALAFTIDRALPIL